MDTHCVSIEVQVKDVGMRIRLEPDLREAFVQQCRLQNTCAAQVLREFMRAYVLSPAQQPKMANDVAVNEDR